MSRSGNELSDYDTPGPECYLSVALPDPSMVRADPGFTRGSIRLKLGLRGTIQIEYILNNRELGVAINRRNGHNRSRQLRINTLLYSPLSLHRVTGIH